VQQAHAKTKANQALLVYAYEDEAKCRMLNLEGYIIHQLQVAGTVSTKVAGDHLLLRVTGRSLRCRSGSEIPGAGL